MARGASSTAYLLVVRRSVARSGRSTMRVTPPNWCSSDGAAMTPLATRSRQLRRSAGPDSALGPEKALLVPLWARRSRLNKPAADRVPRQLDAIAHAELLEDVRSMALDGLLRDVQQRPDLVVRVGLGDELDDLLLARREHLVVDGLAGAGALEILAHQRPDGARIQKRLTAHRGAAGLDQITVDGALEHIARGAHPDSLEQVLLVVVHREHQHAHLGPAVRDLARRLQAGLARHRDVEDHEVDIFGERPVHRLLTVRRLCDDLQIGLGVEHRPESLEHDRVVVGDEDAGLQRNRHCVPGSWGIESLITVPPPGCELISS